MSQVLELLEKGRRMRVGNLIKSASKKRLKNCDKRSLKVSVRSKECSDFPLGLVGQEMRNKIPASFGEVGQGCIVI